MTEQDYQEVRQAPAPGKTFDYELFRADIRKKMNPPLGWTRIKLARRCGVSEARMIDVVRGRKWGRTTTKPSLELTLAICKALGFDVWTYFD